MEIALLLHCVNFTFCFLVHRNRFPHPVFFGCLLLLFLGELFPQPRGLSLRLPKSWWVMGEKEELWEPHSSWIWSSPDIAIFAISIFHAKFIETLNFITDMQADPERVCSGDDPWSGWKAAQCLWFLRLSWERAN